MLLFKIALTIAVVTTLSIVAERVSPRAAGILSGYPLGTAISLFFIGLERGAGYAGSSAPYTLAGLAALLTFLFIYYWVSSHVRRLAIPAASFCAIAGFLGLGGLLRLLPLPAWAGVLIAAGAIIGYGVVFRSIPNAKIDRRVRLGPGVLLFRASLAAVIIVAITGAAQLVPPNWAGVFSAFPSTTFPLLLILHSTYGPEQAHTVIKNLPTGLWSLLLYTLTVAFVYPQFGILRGTILSFAVATAYLSGLAFFTRRREGLKKGYNQ